MTTIPTEPDPTNEPSTDPDVTPVGPGEDPVVVPDEEQPEIQPI